jgi:hypothetical protein
MARRRNTIFAPHHIIDILNYENDEKSSYTNNIISKINKTFTYYGLVEYLKKQAMYCFALEHDCFHCRITRSIIKGFT